MTQYGYSDQQSDEMWRRYMAEQADQQTRQLRRIADNTATTRVLAVVGLILIGVWLLVAIIFGAIV